MTMFEVDNVPYPGGEGPRAITSARQASMAGLGGCSIVMARKDRGRAGFGG